MPLAGLKLEPGQNLVGCVRTVEPGVLIGQQELPEKADTDHQQQGGTNRRIEPADGFIAIDTVFFNHLHPW